MDEHKEPYEHQFEELERAMPIHLGGLKMLFAIFVIAGAVVGVVFSVIVAYNTKNDGLLTLAHTLTLCGTSAICIFGLWTLYSFQRLHPTWPASWLRDYRHNNLIGQDCCVHLNKDGNYCLHVVGRGKKFSSYNCNGFSDENRFFLRFNLGGWRNRSRNLFLEHHYQVTELEYREIKLERFDCYHEGLTITVRDSDNNSLTLEAKHLLNAIAHHHRKRQGLTSNVTTLLRYLLEYSERKYGQWQEEKVRADDREIDFNLAVSIIEDTIQKLHDSRRFIKSSEGKEIREYLEQRLNKLLAPEPEGSQAA